MIPVRCQSIKSVIYTRTTKKPCILNGYRVFSYLLGQAKGFVLTPILVLYMKTTCTRFAAKIDIEKSRNVKNARQKHSVRDLHLLRESLQENSLFFVGNLYCLNEVTLRMRVKYDTII